MSAIAPELLAILVCPLTRTALRLEGEELISEAAGLAYAVQDGVPIMVPELARPLAIGEGERRTL